MKSVANRWKRRAKYAEAQAIAAGAARLAADEIIAEQARQIAKLTEALSHQPETILSNLAPLFIGYREDTAKSQAQTRLQQMITGANEDVERGVWFPDIEFDESMESRDKWPQSGRISGPPVGQTNLTDHKITNGEVGRSDGQPMFRAGSTSPPPESGLE